MTLGTRVKASREKARLSQRELADKIGISEISVMRLEKGRRAAKSDELKGAFGLLTRVFGLCHAEVLSSSR